MLERTPLEVSQFSTYLQRCARDEAMTYGFPAFLIVIGAALWFAALRQGEKKRFLYGVRITVISVLALIVTVILQQILF